MRGVGSLTDFERGLLAGQPGPFHDFHRTANSRSDRFMIFIQPPLAR
jgi:hypothetical protein